MVGGFAAVPKVRLVMPAIVAIEMIAERLRASELELEIARLRAELEALRRQRRGQE